MTSHHLDGIQISPQARQQAGLAEEASHDAFEFDDATLELALRTVGCNARDLGHFLRGHRARDAAAS